MATISHKSNAIKMLAKQTKGLYTKRLNGILSRVLVFTDFFINTIYFLYIPATLWYFSFFILKV